MSKNAKNSGRATRVVMYTFRDPRPEKQRPRDLLDCEKILAKARAGGVITMYDDGRGADPWFEGRPGADLRALRDIFLKAGYVFWTCDGLTAGRHS